MVEDAKVAGEGRQDSASSQVEAAFGAVEGAVGLGVDIVEIERMRKILKRSSAFARKVFSAEECRYCDATAQPAVHYATRFAAKGGGAQGVGHGLLPGHRRARCGGSPNVEGPTVRCAHRARQAGGAGARRARAAAFAVVHAYRCGGVRHGHHRGSVRAQQERRDPMEELARQFREARTMLDDLDAAAPAPAQPQVPDAQSAMGMVRDAQGRPISGHSTPWRSWRIRLDDRFSQVERWREAGRMLVAGYELRRIVRFGPCGT